MTALLKTIKDVYKEIPLVNEKGELDLNNPDYLKHVQEVKEFIEKHGENGVKMIEMVVEFIIKNTSAVLEDWGPLYFAFLKNATDRSKVLEAFGVPAIMDMPHLNPTLIEDDGEYQLYNCKLADNLTSKLLIMTCPSTGHKHANAVKDACNTIKEALLFMNLGAQKELFEVES